MFYPRRRQRSPVRARVPRSRPSFDTTLLSTAFIDRPGAEQPRPDDRFDIIATDLAHLATILTTDQ